MKKLTNTLLLVFLFTLISNFANAQATAVLDLETFTELDVDINATVNIQHGSTQKVEVTGPQELIDLLNKEIKGDKWEIKYTKRNVKNKKSLEITITITHLNEVEMNGSGKITGSSAFHEDEMEIGINGSGTIELEIYVKELEIGINGSGSTYLKGNAEELDASINGSGDIKAENLICESAEFSVNGSGDSKIHVTKKLSATINGSGSVYYAGQPNTKTLKNGSGSVKNLD
jgi:hypothetical protein